MHQNRASPFASDFCRRRGYRKEFRSEGHFYPFRENLNGGLANGGLRPLSAICAQSSTIVHFCGLFRSLSKGSFRHKMTTIVGNRGQLWTSTLSPHLLSPHLGFPNHFIRRRNRGSLAIFFAEEIAHLGASEDRAIFLGAVKIAAAAAENRAILVHSALESSGAQYFDFNVFALLPPSTARHFVIVIWS